MHIGETRVAKRPAGIRLHVLLVFVNSAGADDDDRCVHHRRAVEHDGLDSPEIDATDDVHRRGHDYVDDADFDERAEAELHDPT